MTKSEETPNTQQDIDEYNEYRDRYIFWFGHENRKERLESGCYRATHHAGAE